MTTAILEDLVHAMDRIAPLRLAEDWDNVGLLVGDAQAPLKRVLLCIDLTIEVVDEAIRKEVDGIVAYHPPIFQPRRRLTHDDAGGRILLAVIQAGIGVHAPHTAADAAEGGVNDWLIEGVGEGATMPIVPSSELPADEACKLVTYGPRDAIASLREGLAEVGAGHIGDYDSCSIELEATGMFRGGPTSNPVVGRRGRLERVDEVRLEMVCGRAALPAAVERLRALHPYEEPPIEIYPQVPRPDARTGAGRRVRLDRPTTTQAIADRLRNHLRTDRMTACERSGRRKHNLVGVCAGSGAELLAPAIDQGCTLFVTGELKHHDVLEARSRGCDVLLAGHTNTERGWLGRCRSNLRRRLPAVEFMLSRADRDPLKTA